MKKICCINFWARVEKITHLSKRNETKWSKTNLFAYLCSCKSTKGVTMEGNNNVYKTIWKNGNNEYNEKYICCFFTIWNLKSTLTYKCGRVVLFFTSVYFAISKLILSFSYSYHVPCIILSNVYFYILHSKFPFLFNWAQSKGSVVNQRVTIFLKLKNIFLLFPTFSKWSYSQRSFDVD